jgi:glycosyltransferase involved in cell wall biosynthesis
VPRAELVIVGAGPERSSLQKLAADLGLDGVIFKGFRVQDLRQRDLLSLYTTSSVFVCSSEHEGLYLAGLEAMSSGLPVVAPRVGGITDWLLHGGTGFLYDFGDRNALAKYVIELLENESLCERLSMAARKRAQEFDLSVVARRWEELYRKVAAEGMARA